MAAGAFGSSEQDNRLKRHAGQALTQKRSDPLEGRLTALTA